MTIIDEIEGRNANRGLGAIASQIYHGARSEGSSRMGAFIVLSAWFFASMEISLEIEAEGVFEEED